MTKEEFIQILDSEGDSYEIVGDKIIIDGGGYFPNLKTLPSDVVFNNEGDVFLKSLKTIPSGIEFKNTGDVFLDVLETLPPGVEFNNGDRVHVKFIHPAYFHRWNGNIEGIDSKTLLNKMIQRGIFSR